MSVAYVDTSALVAVAFDNRSGSAIAGRLDECSRLLASNLLEAELRAVFARERLDFATSLVAGIEWILPDRPLAPEMAAVLESGCEAPTCGTSRQHFMPFRSPARPHS